jgi:DNA-binding XRE family transcriptional regulator
MRAIQRFGKQLQRLRTRRGLTQEQLAVTAGLSRTFLTRLELGQHDPSLSTLVRLAKALRVSVTELLGESVSASQWWQVGGGALCDAGRCRGSCSHRGRDVCRAVSEQTRWTGAPTRSCSRNQIIHWREQSTTICVGLSHKKSSTYSSEYASGFSAPAALHLASNCSRFTSI